MRFNLLKVYVRTFSIKTNLLVVVIEEAIEDGVGADRGDADEVEEHEEGHHVLRCVEQVRCLSYQAEQAGMEKVWVQE